MQHLNLYFFFFAITQCKAARTRFVLHFRPGDLDDVMQFRCRCCTLWNPSLHHLNFTFCDMLRCTIIIFTTLWSIVPQLYFVLAFPLFCAASPTDVCFCFLSKRINFCNGIDSDDYGGIPEHGLRNQAIPRIDGQISAWHDRRCPKPLIIGFFVERSFDCLQCAILSVTHGNLACSVVRRRR